MTIHGVYNFSSRATKHTVTKSTFLLPITNDVFWVKITDQSPRKTSAPRKEIKLNVYKDLYMVWTSVSRQTGRIQKMGQKKPHEPKQNQKLYPCTYLKVF